MSYSLYDYARMLADRRRIEAYCQALRQVVRPESRVLDLGSGLGMFALEAARAGARAVTAIDPNPALHQLSELARRNGLEVATHVARSNEVQLSEPANVLVFDLRGALPLYRGSIATLIDARERLCQANAQLIPYCDRIYAVLVTCKELFKEKQTPWGATELGFELGSLSHRTLNQWYRQELEAEYEMSEPELWCALEYAKLSHTSFENTIELRATRSLAAHGFFLFVEVDLIEGLSYSCRRPADVCVSGSAFFPFPEALPLNEGDRVRIALEAFDAGKEYLWSWKSEVLDGAKQGWRAQQSTLAQGVPPLSEIRARAKDFVPMPNERAAAAVFVLQHFDGQTSNEAIAAALQQQYPSSFAKREDAVAFVAELAEGFAD